MTEYRKDFDNFFEGLSFKELSHEYFLHKEKLDFSVSNVVKNYVKPFPRNDISLAIANRDGVSQQEILNAWDEKKEKACALGTEVHLFGELYPTNRHLIPKNGYEEAVVKFWTELPDYIIPVAMELRMYHREKKFGGTTDIVLYNTKTGTYIIADYKTNEDLFKNFNGKTLLPPFDNFLDTSFNQYQIQLSTYQILFEQTGLPVSSRKLIWLKPDGQYEMFDTEDLTRELKRELINL